MRGLLLFVLACACSSGQIKVASSASDECALTPVIHVLQYPGCVPKPIPSFACIGRCGSYVQVSIIIIKWQWETKCQIINQEEEEKEGWYIFF
jgi:hypothetical protein